MRKPCKDLIGVVSNVLPSCNSGFRESLVILPICVNIARRSLACILWVAFILPEVRCQEEGPALLDERLSEAELQAPVSSVAADLPGEEDSRTKVAKTESESRQFVVYGADFSTRVALASLAEGVRKALIETIGRENEQWEHSIVIQLREEEGPIKMAYFAVPGGYRIQIEMSLARGKPRGLERALLEVLLIEYGLRGRAGEAVESVGVSLWLVAGMQESLRWKEGAREYVMYQALFDKNELYPVEQIMQVKRLEGMDPISEAAFQASSGALVMSLLEQDGGQESMRLMLREMSTFEGDQVALVRKHFPGMNLGPESLSKWWALQLAQMAEKPFPYVLNINETERQLREILKVCFNDSTGSLITIGAHEFRDLLALPITEREACILPVAERLRQFFYRAFPAHRPILREYLLLLGEIVSDKDKQIAERLQNLQAERDRLAALGNRTRDYLEWYRITSSQELTGEFDSFIDLKSRLEVMSGKNEGPIGVYMDSMQRLFSEQRETQDP